MSNAERDTPGALRLSDAELLREDGKHPIRTRQQPIKVAGKEPDIARLLDTILSGAMTTASGALCNAHEARLNTHIVGRAVVETAYNIAIKAAENERDTTFSMFETPKEDAELEQYDLCYLQMLGYIDTMLPHCYELKNLVAKFRATAPSLLLQAVRASINEFVAMLEETQEIKLRCHDILDSLKKREAKLKEDEKQNAKNVDKYEEDKLQNRLYFAKLEKEIVARNNAKRTGNGSYSDSFAETLVEAEISLLRDEVDKLKLEIEVSHVLW